MHAVNQRQYSVQLLFILKAQGLEYKNSEQRNDHAAREQSDFNIV